MTVMGASGSGKPAIIAELKERWGDQVAWKASIDEQKNIIELKFFLG